MSKENIPAEEGKKKKIGGRVTIIIILLVVLGFGGFAFMELQKSRAGRQIENNEDAVTVFAVTTTEAVSGQIKNLLNVNGDIIAESEVDVYSDIAGKLIRRRVELGDYVRKDQIVADVDPSRPGMSYAANPVRATISGTI
ncbi:MAG: efflux RND transporter periplasmic adaptor subunit, partial [Spirochaetales bacterium]|nr:efflux RND transporter periplasmic adaptor subunit [Spirochaetales bacterium]